MTDEELAEKYFDEECPHSYADNREQLEEDVVQGFLAGLKARPQWHDLRKDPNDLPDEGTYLVVWQNNKGYKEIFIMNYEEDDEEELHWVDGDCENQDEYIIAWCELPQFKESE